MNALFFERKKWLASGKAVIYWLYFSRVGTQAMFGYGTSKLCFGKNRISYLISTFSCFLLFLLFVYLSSFISFPASGSCFIFCTQQLATTFFMCIHSATTTPAINLQFIDLSVSSDRFYVVKIQ